MTEHTPKSDREATTVISRALPWMVNNEEFYNEGKYWLHPVAARFLECQENLEESYPNDDNDFEFWIKSFKQSFIDWVSSGLIAKWMTRYRVWKYKFATWRDFCIQALGKTPGTIKRLMDNAEVVKYLAEYGFTILPTNQSQVEKLLACTKKLDCLIEEAWEKVVDTLPEQLITANSIGEILGFPAENINHRLPKELAGILAREANERGLSVNEMLEEDYGTAAASEPPSEEKIKAWEEDLEDLIKEQDERDNQNWFLCVLLKINSWVSEKKSQFDFLRRYNQDLQYQT